MNREEFIAHIRGEQEQLRRFLLALCLGNRDEADDIAQESLVKAYLSSSGYQDKGKFTSWLYRIAHHTFLDHMKNRKSLQPLDTAYEMADSSMPADSSFRYQELYAALDTLPPKERSSILLFYIKGYSVKEICLITDSSEDAVKKQLSRGREHLKTKLKR